MSEKSAKGAIREKAIYAEPVGSFRRDKNASLIYTALATAGLVISIMAFYISFRFFEAFFNSWGLLILVPVFFCTWEIYLNFSLYVSRVRFRVFENAIIPTYIPVMHALHGTGYHIPFSRLRGMSFKIIPKGDVKEWQCDIILDDGRVVEFYGQGTNGKFYKFLERAKEQYGLPDTVAGKGEGNLKDTMKRGYREQLMRWGITPKDKKEN